MRVVEVLGNWERALARWLVYLSRPSPWLARRGVTYQAIVRVGAWLGFPMIIVPPLWTQGELTPGTPAEVIVRVALAYSAGALVPMMFVTLLQMRGSRWCWRGGALVALFAVPWGILDGGSVYVGALAALGGPDALYPLRLGFHQGIIFMFGMLMFGALDHVASLADGLEKARQSV